MGRPFGSSKSFLSLGKCFMTDKASTSLGLPCHQHIYCDAGNFPGTFDLGLKPIFGQNQYTKTAFLQIILTKVGTVPKYFFKAQVQRSYLQTFIRKDSRGVQKWRDSHPTQCKIVLWTNTKNPVHSIISLSIWFFRHRSRQIIWFQCSPFLLQIGLIYIEQVARAVGESSCFVAIQLPIAVSFEAVRSF